MAMALVPSACDGDDDTVGGGGTGGSGNASNAGHGGSTAAKGGGSGKGGVGGSPNAGRGGTAGRGGSNGSGTGGTLDMAGSGGDDPGASGAPGSGGTAAGAGGESAAAGQPGGSGQAGQAGSGGEGGDASTEPLEIAGTWENADFGETDVIAADSWSQDYGTGPTVSAIVKFSNSDNFAIRQAPADATFDPNKFDRTVWTEIDGGHFYYCTIDHGLDTAEEAEASTTAFDASDPESGGCGGFPWTKLTAQ